MLNQSSIWMVRLSELVVEGFAECREVGGRLLDNGPVGGGQHRGEEEFAGAGAVAAFLATAVEVGDIAVEAETDLG